MFAIRGLASVDQIGDGAESGPTSFVAASAIGPTFPPTLVTSSSKLMNVRKCKDAPWQCKVAGQRAQK